MNIRFEPIKHQYFDEQGREFVSVTRICGITPRHPDFDRVDPAKLSAAQKRGNLIHDGSERLIKLGENDGLLATTDWVEENIVTKYQDITAEEIVYDDRGPVLFAGKVDIIARNGANVDIYDIKTGGHDTVDYQLSLYKRAFCYNTDTAPENVRLFLIDFSNDDNYRCVPVREIPSDWLDNLLLAYWHGVPYIEPNIIPVGVSKEMLDVVRRCEVAIEEGKKAEEISKSIRAEILKAMLENNIETFDSEELHFTAIAATTRKSLDTKAVENYLKEHGENVDEFKKVSEVAPQLRVKKR